ncbi:hypothetical protein Sjap_007669 [Stephania japonica]|uniref:Leucine-rich repeat-containing N-terminal plant-type domain-containing protein n=1 Tax=Stephania japonica TaxID=461633 RepID=A0AAP0JNX7_9MAGN
MRKTRRMKTHHKVNTSSSFSVALCLIVLILSSLGKTTMAILDPVDFLALQSIRKSLEDMPGSNFFSSWDFTSDPCNFAGVMCDSDKVISLNLGDPRAGAPGLTGRLDPAIGKLTALAEFSVVPGRELHLRRDSGEFHRSPAAPDSRPQLQPSHRSHPSGDRNASGAHQPRPLPQPPLRRRAAARLPNPNASRSKTQRTLRRSLAALPSFISQYLSLSANRLSGPVDRLLARLDRLSYLDLSMNRFTGTIPSCLFSFPISSLQLQRNLFSGEVRPEGQVAISIVDLSFNRLYGEISPMFSAVQNLYLNNNKFAGKVPGSFVDRLMASSMEILYLQHNYLTGIEINPTAELPISSSLCLQYNCMIPPLQTTCPLKAGTQKSRPTSQCVEWKG